MPSQIRLDISCVQMIQMKSKVLFSLKNKNKLECPLQQLIAFKNQNVAGDFGRKQPPSFTNCLKIKM